MKQKYVLKFIGLIFIFYLLHVQHKLAAQQTPIYTHYIFNGFIINPALAGVDGSKIINLSTRQQWVGYEGYPRTNWISYHTRILKRRFILKNSFGSKKYKPKTSGKTAFGAYFYNDRNGVIGRNGGQVSYAYHTFFNRRTTQLSLGLSAQLYHLNFNRDLMILKNENDPFLNSVGKMNYFIPDFSIGANLLGRSYFAGITAAQLLQSKFKIYGQDLGGYKNPRIYYVMAGYKYYPYQDYLIEPSFLAKFNEQFKYQVDFSLKVSYNDNLWMGISYRSNKDIITLLGFKYSNFHFSYAFEYPTTSLKSQNYGTHELSISAIIGSSEKRFRWQDRY